MQINHLLLSGPLHSYPFSSIPNIKDVLFFLLNLCIYFIFPDSKESYFSIMNLAANEHAFLPCVLEYGNKIKCTGDRVQQDQYKKPVRE